MFSQCYLAPAIYRKWPHVLLRTGSHLFHLKSLCDGDTRMMQSKAQKSGCTSHPCREIRSLQLWDFLIQWNSGTYNCFISLDLKTREIEPRGVEFPTFVQVAAGRANQSPALPSGTCVLIPTCYFFPVMRVTFPLIKIPLQM